MFSGPISVLMLVVFISPVQAWHFPDFSSYDNGNYNVSWKINRILFRLYFKLEVSTTGWVGFGIANEAPTNMTDYDVAVGGVYDNGSCYLKDYLTIGHVQPRLDLQQDWKLVNCSEDNGVTKLEFYRAKNTSDENDTVVQEGKSMFIVWAYHNTTDVANMTFPKHTARGYDKKTLWPEASATTTATVTPSSTTATTVTPSSTTATTVTPSSTTSTVTHSPTTSTVTHSPTTSSILCCTSTSATTPLVPTNPAKPTTRPPEKTCARLGVKVDASWNESFENKSSEKYKERTTSFSIALTMLYNVSGKYDDVAISNVTLTEKDKMVFAKGKLCLVFNGDEKDFIEDVFKNKVKSGKLDEGFPVIICSTEFEAIGVSFEDWNVKKDECKKCEKGGGGPIVIVRPCEVKTKGFSCKGLTTKESKDCVEYCPSSSAGTTVSLLILAIGIFLSFSFQ